MAWLSATRALWLSGPLCNIRKDLRASLGEVGNAQRHCRFRGPDQLPHINEFPAGRLLRDAKLYEIGAGTSEIRRMLIGRELFNESV